jgi:hypothetical protein
VTTAAFLLAGAGVIAVSSADSASAQVVRGDGVGAVIASAAKSTGGAVTQSPVGLLADAVGPSSDLTPPGPDPVTVGDSSAGASPPVEVPAPAPEPKPPTSPVPAPAPVPARPGNGAHAPSPVLPPADPPAGLAAEPADQDDVPTQPAGGAACTKGVLHDHDPRVDDLLASGRLALAEVLSSARWTHEWAHLGCDVVPVEETASPQPAPAAPDTPAPAPGSGTPAVDPAPPVAPRSTPVRDVPATDAGRDAAPGTDKPGPKIPAVPVLDGPDAPAVVGPRTDAGRVGPSPADLATVPDPSLATAPLATAVPPSALCVGSADIGTTVPSGTDRDGPDTYSRPGSAPIEAAVQAIAAVPDQTPAPAPLSPTAPMPAPAPAAPFSGGACPTSSSAGSGTGGPGGAHNLPWAVHTSALALNAANAPGAVLLDSSAPVIGRAVVPGSSPG